MLTAVLLCLGRVREMRLRQRRDALVAPQVPRLDGSRRVSALRRAAHLQEHLHHVPLAHEHKRRLPRL